MASLLEQINSPEELKRLSRDELVQLAAEIRRFLLETLAKTGGHLGANLGVVELALALHYVFDSPRDRLLWDVSHQIYTHKLLTGRRELFPTLRQLDGLAGFASKSESEHDPFDMGHGGTSISCALGMARARALRGVTDHVVAVIGDGALTSGMVLEALNDAGHSNTNLLVVLNDNAMSISPNVGALARYLSHIRSEPRYLQARKRFEALMRRLPGGGAVVELVRRLKAGVKHMVLPGGLFEDLGFTYLGPVDGHNIGELIASLRHAHDMEGPVLLHVLTTKGKGYSPAENHCSRLHAVTEFDIETGEPLAEVCGDTFTSTFGDTLCRLAEEEPRIIAITAAMCDGTGLAEFKERFPERFLDVGMAEEHAVTLAAGLAAEGMRPVAAIYSTFLQRSYDQILHDVCLQKLPVVLALDRAGVVGEDGPTHHGLFDLSYLRAMPNLTVMAPATLTELEAMLEASLAHDGPTAIRYPKGRETPCPAGDPAGIARGQAAVLRAGKDVALFAIGSMLPAALDTAELLAQGGIEATVVNARFVKPLDAHTLLDAARRVELVITLEENAIAGGFGAAVAELFAAAGVRTPLHIMGVPDLFVGQGPRQALLMRLGLAPEQITHTARALLSRPKPRTSISGTRQPSR